MATHWGWLVSWARDHSILLLMARWTFATLARLVISSEREHVSEIFSELSCTREATLSDAHPWLWVLGSMISCLCCVIRIYDIVLAVLKTLSSILSQNRRMRGWGSWNHACIWNARQMATFCRVESIERRWLRRMKSYARCTMISRLSFRPAAHEAWMYYRYWITTGSSTSRGWPHTISLVRLSTAEHSLASGSENSLQQRTAVFLSRGLIRRFVVVDGSILTTKAFVDVVRGRTHSSWVCRARLQFHACVFKKCAIF